MSTPVTPRKRRAPLWFHGAFWATGLLLCGWNLAMLMTLPDWCGSTVVTSVPEPDGPRCAVIYGTDCGAGSSYTSLVSIVPSFLGRTTNWPAAFAAEGGYSGPAHGPAVHAKWLARGRLLILYESGSHVLYADPESCGVTIVTKPASDQELRALGAAVPDPATP